MKKVWIMILITFIALTGCAKAPEKNTATALSETQQEIIVETPVAEAVYPLTIEDKFGNSVILEKAPERVINFSPELVEIMYELGVENTLIGRSTYCDYPEEALKVQDMGDLFNLSIETIVESKPDLILLSSMVNEDIIKSLTDQGIQVVALDADTNIEGAYYYIQMVGKIFDVQPKATELITSMQQEIAAIGTKVEGLEKPLAYFAVWVGDYDSAATGDTFIGNLIELAGAENAAADGINWMYSVEQVIEKDPDIVLCSMYWDFKEKVEAQEGYKDLRAVKEGHLYEVDENIFYRQGPRLVEAVKVLAEIFHPEAF